MNKCHYNSYKLQLA